MRGAGKTTLLFQLYSHIRETDCYTIFLSLDHTYGLLNISLTDIISTYEQILGLNYELLDKPLIIFLDETQYDPDWFTVLQTLMNRSDKIFVFIAGSTLLRSNQENDDRFISLDIAPITSPEYIKITKQKFQIP